MAEPKKEESLIIPTKDGAAIDPPSDIEKEFELSTLKDLQAVLVDMDFVGADLFTTKKQAIAVIKSLREKLAKEQENARSVDEQLGTAVQTMKKNEKGETLVVDPLAPKTRDPKAERTDAQRWAGKAGAMRKKLMEGPQTSFMIPLGLGEKRGAYESVIMNGYRLNIMKGVMVTIPVPVAQILADSYQMTAEAGKDFALDRSELVKEVLG